MTPEPASRPSVDVFRQAMGRFATGVTVVTTFADGHDHAMTANAFASVSLEPLLVLVCVEQDARFHEAVVGSGTWGVSVLPAGHRSVAEWLSTPGRPLHGQLDRVPFHRGSVTGVALIDGALAHVECRTTDVHPAGDHSVLVGAVQSLWIDDDPGAALLYYRGRYGRVE